MHCLIQIDCAQVFLGGALKEHLKGTRDDLDRLVPSASNRMTSTIYKFEYRQGIVVVTFSAAMLWKQDYAQGAHVCRVPCQNRRDTMVLLVAMAAGRLAASHLGLDKNATALSLFGLPKSQEIISGCHSPLRPLQIRVRGPRPIPARRTESPTRTTRT